jgi:hypothetical protein
MLVQLAREWPVVFLHLITDEEDGALLRIEPAA